MSDRLIRFNKCFTEANATKKRYRIFMGGAGSGKSVNAAMDYIIKLMDKKYTGANLLVVRKVEQSNRNSTFAELCSAIQRICGSRADELWDIKESTMEITCKVTGNKIIFCGFNDRRQREKVKSINFKNGKLTWIWIEEATELSENDVDILDDRLRGNLENENLYYQITLTFNPVSSRHWIKRRYFDSVNDDYFISHSTYKDNSFIDPDYHRRMENRKIFDPEGYKVYALGQWGEHEGLILSNYTVCEFNEDFDEVILGQDFGFNHANAIVAVGFRDGCIYIFDELYEHEKDTTELIALAEGRFNKKCMMICDSAEPDRIKMWRKAGYCAVAAKKGAGSVLTQIDFLKGSKIFISPRCENLISELENWKWQKDNDGQFTDMPVNVYDDAIAALRYAISVKISGEQGISFLK